MNNPFSVLISVYAKERPEYLQEALDSITKYQTVKPTEIVLVKDGPLTAELEQVIDESQREYPIYKIIQNPVNLGLGRSLALGLQECGYEYVARMDSDDISKPHRFEMLLKKIEEGYDVVSSNCEYFFGSLENIVHKQTPETHEDIVKGMKSRNSISHGGTMFRKSKVLAASNYQDFPMFEDYYLWVRMIRAGAKFFSIYESLYFFRATLELFQRRGGFSYLRAENKLHYGFVRIGFISFPKYVYNMIPRAVMRLLPNYLREKGYVYMWKRDVRLNRKYKAEMGKPSPVSVHKVRH